MNENIWLWYMYESISEEGSNSVFDVTEEFIELLLSVEFLILTQCSVIVSHMLPDFLVKAVSERWDSNDCSYCSGDDV